MVTVESPRHSQPSYEKAPGHKNKEVVAEKVRPFLSSAHYCCSLFLSPLLSLSPLKYHDFLSWYLRIRRKGVTRNMWNRWLDGSQDTWGEEKGREDVFSCCVSVYVGAENSEQAWANQQEETTRGIQGRCWCKQHQQKKRSPTLCAGSEDLGFKSSSRISERQNKNSTSNSLNHSRTAKNEAHNKQGLRGSLRTCLKHSPQKAEIVAISDCSLLKVRSIAGFCEDI